MDVSIQVRVIRCKDCKHAGKPSVQVQRYGMKGVLKCKNVNSPCNARLVLPNDFCPYGKLDTRRQLRIEELMEGVK